MIMNRKKGIERRKNKRYKAVKGSYASINPTSRIIGPITDISMGGLAFKYTDTGGDNSIEEPLEEKTICLSNLGYFVGNISFKTVSEKEITTVPSFLSGSMKVKLKQVQFVALDFQQMIDLDNYLRNNVYEPLENFPPDNDNKENLPPE